MTTHEQHWLHQQLEPNSTNVLLGGNMKQYKPLPVSYTDAEQQRKVDWIRLHPEQDATLQDEHLKKHGIL